MEQELAAAMIEAARLLRQYRADASLRIGILRADHAMELGSLEAHQDACARLAEVLYRAGSAADLTASAAPAGGSELVGRAAGRAYAA